MADSKISALTDGSPVQSTDAFVVARSGANFKIPYSALATVLASDKKTLTSGDITFSNTTFTDVSSSLDITITTGAHRCLVAWTTVGTTSSGAQVQLDVSVDGTLQGQTFGLVFSGGVTGQNFNLSGSYVTA